MLKDILEESLKEYIEEKKLKTNKWKCYIDKYKILFYYIYVHNVILGNFFNNKHGYFQCSCKNYQKISKYSYREIIDHMCKNKLIIYPIKGKHVGKIKNTDWSNRISHILKPVKISDEVLSNISIEEENNSIMNNPEIMNQINQIGFYDYYGELILENKPKIIELPIYEIPKTFDLLSIYKGIRLDESKLKSSLNLRDPEDLSIYNETISKYNSQSYSGKIDNRIFTWFHTISSKVRHCFTINNSYLKEAFDIHACSYCIIAKLLESIPNINISELSKFQYMVKYTYIYKNIADFGNIPFDDNNKKILKKAAQTWLNMLPNSIKRSINCSFKNSSKSNSFLFRKMLKLVDNWFESEYPNIASIIKNWKTEPSKNYPNKLSKTIWKDYQKIEFEIISEKICNYLWNKYKILPITVHDAVYISENDAKQISENVENIFWNFLNLKFLPEKIS